MEGSITAMFATHLVLDQIPPPSALSHIHTAQFTNSGSNQQANHSVASDGTHYFVGAALPAIPTKIIEKIESGAFTKLSDLLLEHLGHAEPDEDPKSKSKHRPVTSITQWLQCFAVYTAVISKKQPHRVMDLMGYQILIIEAYHEYRNDSWLNYDRRFRLRAASQPGRSWAAIDSTIWNLAFAGQAKATRCNHCFSFAHSTSNCHLSGYNTEKKLLTRQSVPFIQPKASEVNQYATSGTTVDSQTVLTTIVVLRTSATFVLQTHKQQMLTTRLCFVLQSNKGYSNGKFKHKLDFDCWHTVYYVIFVVITCVVNVRYRFNATSHSRVSHSGVQSIML